MRSGNKSSDYISFIIDVHISNITNSGGKKIWIANQFILSRVLLLLQDVELANKQQGQSSRLSKITYGKAVNACGYTTDLTSPEQRDINLVCGQAIMGRHTGKPLDWGFCENDEKPDIDLGIANFDDSAIEIEASSGIYPKYKKEGDLLSCYREHPKFNSTDYYWDFMPKHEHIIEIFTAMNNSNKVETENFVQKILLWRKL